MDFSSSSSSSSSQYKGRVLPPKPRWDFPIYESTPHYPPPAMDTRIPALSSQEIGRFASSPTYADYAYNYSGGDGGSGASTAERGEDEGGGRRSEAAEEREHMFDKVVTPSDVGKLNRLVIPKQHAEKYFPLDSSSTEKGLLLNFEDRNGKSWRFRYSYWNSSQSYVMTKGWSRFVKEKKLDAGDIVSFQRGLGEIGKDHFYIDWRRRPDAPPPTHHGFALHRPIYSPFVVGPRVPPPALGYHHHQARDHGQLVGIVTHPNHHRGSVVSYNGLASAPMSGYGGNYGALSSNFHHQGPMLYLRAAVPPQQMQMQPGSSRAGATPEVFDSVPVVHGKAAAAKRLRLFGVNMDCAAQEPPHRLVLDSPAGSSSGEAALQLRLHDGGISGSSASAAGSFPASEFPDKGKSSMSLDFDI